MIKRAKINQARQAAPPTDGQGTDFTPNATMKPKTSKERPLWLAPIFFLGACFGLLLLALLPIWWISRPSQPSATLSAPTPSTSSPSLPSASDRPSDSADQSAPAGTHRIQGSSRVGCSDAQYQKKLIGFAAQGDKEAFADALRAGVLSGECTIFDDGEPVFLEGNGGLFDGTVQVRRPGQSTSWWTNMEAID